MIKVKAHQLKFPDAEGELEFVGEEVAQAPGYIGKNPKNLGVFFTESLRLLGFRFFLNKPQATQLEALRLASEYGVGLFRRGSATPDETVTFDAAGQSISVAGGTSEFNTAPRWLSAYGAAMVLRDTDAADSLAGYNPIDFEGSYDQYHIAIACALMAEHNGSADTAAVYDEAVKQAQNASMFPEWGKKVGLPLARMARAVYEKKSDGFSELVAEALEGYAQLYGRKGENHLAEAVLPLAHIGLCARALDRSMTLEVESDYLPDWMLKGNF